MPSRQAIPWGPSPSRAPRRVRAAEVCDAFEKGLAEFRLSQKPEKSGIHFLTGFAGQKILLSRKCARRARTAGAAPILEGAKNQAENLTPPYTTFSNEAAAPVPLPKFYFMGTPSRFDLRGRTQFALAPRFCFAKRLCGAPAPRTTPWFTAFQALSAPERCRADPRG